MATRKAGAPIVTATAVLPIAETIRLFLATKAGEAIRAVAFTSETTIPIIKSLTPLLP